MIRITDDILQVDGVGSETAKKLSTIGVNSIVDLIEYWPRRYDDFSHVVKISASKPGQLTIIGQFSSVKSRYTRKGRSFTEAIASDDSGSIKVLWFNQPYRAKTIKPHAKYYISGVFDVHSGRLSLVNPTIIEYIKGQSTDLIVPIYPENKLVPSNLILKILKKAKSYIDLLPETLPSSVTDEYQLMSRHEATRLMHFPKSLEDLKKARERLAFEELFQMQLASELIKNEIEIEKAPRITFDVDYIKGSISHLPYQLTDDQRRVLWQIYKDLDKDHPMNRLVEGDVGSGKTIIAALSALMVLKHGYQVMFMAPTEILAKQHAETLFKFFEKTEYKYSLALLIGSVKKQVKTHIHQQIKEGKCKMVIGTHALLQDKVVASNVGLVIVDEQHRFGVKQRQLLKQKSGVVPHFLSLTATPIPRTLALTLYGELDISLIKSMPSNRKRTETKIVPHSARYNLYQTIEEMVNKGNQAFVVCPLIQESDFLPAQSAEKIYDELKNKLLKKCVVGLLHGKMKTEEKEEVMRLFREKKLNVLVSTTVIEVGVDIPDANIIIIESAERFGLAQIHQLRGRVGRSGGQGYCFLVPSLDIGETKRLRAVESTLDGFKLAELDLELRGPGSIYGIRQSGLLDLRVASLSDKELIIKTKKAAKEFIATGMSVLQYPELNSRVKHFQSLNRLN